MSSTDDTPRVGADRDRERDRAGKAKGPAGKAKDLSHVPCKFFKVGSCTAGASCPFSHSSVEPGQVKDTCAWFIKGNCKFGHKCALAHILPGQTMAMDRRNKKDAQRAAGPGPSAGGGGLRDGGRGTRGQRSTGKEGGRPARNSLLAGISAPTRHSSRPPGLTAALSPPAPAPPLQDTDFTPFAALDEASKLPNAPAAAPPADAGSAQDDAPPEVAVEAPAEPAPASFDGGSPIPVTVPRRSSVTSHPDFGPIGSPPRSIAGGLSPGTSPRGAPSPFSAPGTQTSFRIDYNDGPGAATGGRDFRARAGIAASLGATRNWASEYGTHGNPGDGTQLGSSALADDDDELEDFVPGSLSDLLTPEERLRRLSRSGAQRPGALLVPAPQTAHAVQTAGTQLDAQNHKYSRSVPAASLLGDVSSIWRTDAGLPSSPNAGGLGNGTPSSFKAGATGFGGRALVDDSAAGLSRSPTGPLLSPTNASAAFLPSLHQQYAQARAGGTAHRPPPLGGLHAPPPAGMGQGLPGSLSANALLGHAGARGGAFSPPRAPHAFGPRPPFEAHPSEPLLAPHGGMPGDDLFGPGAPGAHNPAGFADAGPMSPGARALQAHAPGQSLPQGLAAGYSRIHARPSMPSPAAVPGGGAFSPPRGAGGFAPGTPGGALGYTEWLAGGGQTPQGGPQGGEEVGGLSALMSRLSYGPAPGAPPGGMPPGLGYGQPPPQGQLSAGRHASGTGRGWGGPQGPTSPLRRPIAMGGDDELFDMDH